MKATALAIFVKTPGISPIKTRLAATLGKDPAELFYNLSVGAIESMAKKAHQLTPSIIPIWAIAEEKGMESPRWNGFEKIYQGTGNLGDRLHRVYSELLSQFSSVLIIGSDSPQLDSDTILQASEILNDPKYSYVIGDCLDGGFYLFGGSKPIEKNKWLSVTYSADTTSHELKKQLNPQDSVFELKPYFDVDTENDLVELGAYQSEHLTSQQKNVIKWASDSIELD